MSHFEGSVRVPLVFSGTGVKAGQRINTPVSLIDMAPTICRLTGMELRNCFDGESLVPLLHGDLQNNRGWALSTYCGVTSNTMSWMLRRGDYKLILYQGYRSRLFNLREDPSELHDLIDQEPDVAEELLRVIDNTANRGETFERWEEYRRHSFAQFQRQAKAGLYHDSSYSLASNPSSDYQDLMNNAFTGWDERDESRVARWLYPN